MSPGKCLGNERQEMQALAGMCPNRARFREDELKRTSPLLQCALKRWPVDQDADCQTRTSVTALFFLNMKTRSHLADRIPRYKLLVRQFDKTIPCSCCFNFGRSPNNVSWELAGMWICTLKVNGIFFSNVDRQLKLLFLISLSAGLPHGLFTQSLV